MTLMLAALAFNGTALAAPGHLVAGFDLERAGSMHAEGPSLASGYGLRFGYGFELGALEVIPEGRFMRWGHSGTRYGTTEIGGRVMFMKGLEPGAYARVVLPMGAEGEGAGWTAGGLLDLTLAPKFDVGVHLGVLSGRERVSTVAGAHLNVNF